MALYRSDFFNVEILIPEQISKHSIPWQNAFSKRGFRVCERKKERLFGIVAKPSDVHHHLNLCQFILVR